MCHTLGMGLFNDTKASSIGADAAQALAAGRFVFVAMLHGGMTYRGMSREIEAWSEQIMAIEQAGWMLTHSSVVEDNASPKMYAVFHRR
jgi:tellurite resistance-related uncharacterized protein